MPSPAGDGIAGPLYECQSRITTTLTPPGSFVHVESAKHGMISSYYPVESGTTLIPVAPSLESGDVISLVHVGCDGTTSYSQRSDGESAAQSGHADGDHSRCSIAAGDPGVLV